MKLNYRPLLKKILQFVIRFRSAIVGGMVVLTLLAAIVRINQHSSVDINQDRYDQEISTIRRVNFDQDTIQTVLDLNDLNIDIDSIFPDNRKNPFN